MPPFAVTSVLPPAALHALLGVGLRSAKEVNERTLRTLAHQKRWIEAARFVEARGFGEADVQSVRLLPHIARCAALADAAADADAMRARIAQLDPGRVLLRTHPLTGGMASVALFLHELRTAGGERVTMFEKVYPGERRGRASDEVRLFRELDHRRLLAPPFFGMVRGAGLLSMYYAYVPGRPPRRFGFARTRRELVARLWQATPTAALARGMGVRARRPIEAVAASIAQAPRGSVQLRRAGGRIVAALEGACGAQVERACVLHADLHSRNCLRQADGSHVLVDWDRFRLAPVGFGLETTRSEFAKASFRAWVARQLPPGGKHDLSEVLEHVAMDQLLRCLHANDHAGAEAWAREIG